MGSSRAETDPAPGSERQKEHPPFFEPLLGPDSPVSGSADDPGLRLAGLEHGLKVRVDFGMVPPRRVRPETEIHRHVTRDDHDRADGRLENLVDVVDRLL